MRRRNRHLAQPHTAPVSVDQSIQVPVFDPVWIDYRDLLESCARETLKYDRTDTPSSHNADVGTSQPGLGLDSPAVQGPHQALSPDVWRVRAWSAIRARGPRAHAPHRPAVSGVDAASRFPPEPRTPATIGAHGHPKERQPRLPNERCDQVALRVFVNVAQRLPARSGMTVQHGHPCPRLQRPVEHTVHVAAVNRNVSVQTAIPVFGQKDLAQDPGVATHAVPPVPQRQAGLLLVLAPAQSAQEVLRQRPVQRFPDQDPMDQRALQIRRMCRVRYVFMLLVSGGSIRSQKSLGGALIAIQASPSSPS